MSLSSTRGIEALNKAISAAPIRAIKDLPPEVTAGTEIHKFASRFNGNGAVMLLASTPATGTFNGERVISHSDIPSDTFLAIPGRGNTMMLIGPKSALLELKESIACNPPYHNL